MSEQLIAPPGQAMPEAPGPLAAVPLVCVTQAALDLLDVVVARHGPVMFHQSGGCCDGSAPMCYPLGSFLLADHDKLLGHIGGHPFYMGGQQYEYWKHTQLTIDVVPGRGGMFSLEGPEGKRFLTRSRLFSPAEWAWLQANGKVEAGHPAPAATAPAA